MSKTITITLLITFLILLAAFLFFGEPGSDHSKPSEETPKLSEVKPPQQEIPSELIDQIIVPFNKGVALMEQYKSVEAVKAFEEVVRLAPNWITGRLNLGIALLNAQNDKDIVRAEEELKWVIERAPDNPYAHYALGMLFRHLGIFEEAIIQFEKVLKIDPEDADTHYQLGILIMDKDPVAARTHLEKTLAKVPHHETATYRLHKLLRGAGEKKRALEMLKRYHALKSSGAGVFYGMKYGEMGRYAGVVRAFGQPVSSLETQTIPTYTNIAKPAGLTLVTQGTAGWPAMSSQRTAMAFGPGIAVADVEGKNDLYLYMTGIGSEQLGMLYQYRAGQFSLVQGTGIDGRNAIGAYFGDYDGDGDPDLYLTCVGPNRLYRNDGGVRFTDVTTASGTGGGAFLSVGAAWADADHDGDIDLYVTNFSSLTGEADGAPNFLWRNNGNGSFTEVATDSGIEGENAASMAILFFDIDDDRDLDLYLINQGSSNRLFLNDRVGQYTEATAWFPELADAGPGLGALLGDVDLNGREDILLLRGPEPPRLFLQVERGSFVEDAAFKSNGWGLEGAAGGLFGDIDLDGDLDMILLSAATQGKIGHQILMNKGTGHFDSPVTFGEERNMQDSRGAVAVDIDRDGSLELIVTRIGAAPELWHTPAPENQHWLEVIPTQGGEKEVFWVEPTADGLLVEVKSGRRLQVASVTASAGYLGGPPRRLHFGLGKSGKADYVRLSWPDAVLQNELEVTADQSWRITKMQRKPSSCPILFVWDGERFAFVTDFLGVGGVGFFLAPGEYAPPDPTEDIRIPPELVAPRAGRYLLRVTEPLEEVTYFDQLHLVAYDHPDDWEIYPDERFTGTQPFPTGKPFAVAEKIFPQAAQNHRGEDVLDQIREIDRRYMEPPKDARFVGYADDHWIELDFGDQLQNLEADASLILYLYGWVEYTYSHVNYAAHQAGITMRSPWIEVPDGKGGWRVAMPEAGFPAGLPRMMTLDISSLPIRQEGRMRIRTNMEVFWDQIFVGENVLSPELRVNTLQPTVAELRSLGYPREFSPDGADPTIYDYQRLDQGVPFKNMTGDFTRFGDVRELLKNVDDQFVIMARGEEIALEFEASKLPELAAGWTRTIVLHTDGYCKDMDLYTAFPDTVKPLPYHGMKNYPPAEPAPNLKVSQEYQRVWNTRRIVGN